MAQVKELNPAQAQNNPNRNSESGGEKRTRTRRPYYNRRPRRAQQPKEAAVPIHIYPLGGLGEAGKMATVRAQRGCDHWDHGLYSRTVMYGGHGHPRLYLCGAE